MENIKNLLGESYHDGITVEEIESALSGKKLVDLASGEYVAKDKYEKLNAKYTTLQTDYEAHKEQTKDYETLKTENEAFKGEKATNELKAKLQAVGIDPKFYQYVKVDLDSHSLAFDEDEAKNKEVATEYLKGHPEFALKVEAPAPSTQPSKVIGTGVEGGTQVQKSTNEKVSEALRGLVGVNTDN